jgi:hypothetical protein
MVRENIFFGYVPACADGKLPLSECGPVWQLGIIATLPVLVMLTLIALRVSRSGMVHRP